LREAGFCEAEIGRLIETGVLGRHAAQGGSA
jgi:hypothetical protein